ncbi:uncharacterized protein C3orf22 homolog [Nycticebus coucang]|uniref:uncharacterized protein C3orf22 homolog n=1 Tax=Nycticebus coucang TaxID=9470 RepID=UPI00234C392E|nr:uncharacterized protein C3orf22 homolog [Nycticebus coucang]
MASGTHKKSHQSKKSRSKAQEKFANMFPYRLSWLTEPSPEALQNWEATSSLAKEQLPLQKRLVPTRSIPVRGLGAPDFTQSSSPPPPPSPLCYLWELKLLNHRFSRQGAPRLGPAPADSEHPYTNEAPGLSTGLY